MAHKIPSVQLDVLYNDHFLYVAFEEATAHMYKKKAATKGRANKS
jgi:hypothetical protein